MVCLQCVPQRSGLVAPQDSLENASAADFPETGRKLADLCCLESTGRTCRSSHHCATSSARQLVSRAEDLLGAGLPRAIFYCWLEFFSSSWSISFSLLSYYLVQSQSHSVLQYGLSGLGALWSQRLCCFIAVWCALV